MDGEKNALILGRLQHCLVGYNIVTMLRGKKKIKRKIKETLMVLSIQKIT